MKFESRSIEEVKAELQPKPQVQRVALETKEYHVVDPETGQVVGTIDAPLSFCNIAGCPASAGKRNPFGFINPLNKKLERRDLWVHEHCLHPTKAWWDGAWHRLVLPVEGVTMPWESGT